MCNVRSVFILLVSIIFTCHLSKIYAQSNPDSIYSYSSPMPSYPGGIDSMQAFLKRNMRPPQGEMKIDIEGRVAVKVAINKEGWIENPVVVKSLSPYADQEALRLVRMMMPWNPGMMNGEPVNVSYVIPVNFAIEGNKVVEHKVIYNYVDKAPSAPYDYQQFLNRNIQYPRSALDAGISDRIIVKFVVDETGQIKDPVVVRPTDSALCREALRVVSMMPKWNPAMLGGKEVDAYFTLPIVFQLNNTLKQTGRR